MFIKIQEVATVNIINQIPTYASGTLYIASQLQYTTSWISEYFILIHFYLFPTFQEKLPQKTESKNVQLLAA